MSFAKKMIELRKQQDLSQQDLADRLGVSRQAISRWETGAVQPLADSVKSLAQVFQVSTDYLLNDDLDTPTPTRKHRKWLLALAALAAAAVLVLATALGTIRYPCMTYYLRRTMVNQMDHSQFHGKERR